MPNQSTVQPSFFFYDLETTGFDARNARIMQFAGQRTNIDLVPVGEPLNVFIKLTPDVLPDPDAILITGITPQQTLQAGVTEAEFLKLFYDQAVRPNTTFMGFNTVRFDDEFMRFLHYRNFYDAYEWEWKDGCSRWDLLDVVRMTRALRPDNIIWPFLPDGKPTNRLELLASVNKLDHTKAHDAMSDVEVTIAMARLVKSKQPDLFEYLFSHRQKNTVKPVVEGGKAFVYTSGKYGSQFLHTTAAVRLAPHPDQDAALVYDLRFDPTDFLAKTPEELAEHWRYSRDPEHVRLPVKTLKYNRCPAIAPLSVLDEASQTRLKLPLGTVTKHLEILKTHQQDFAKNIITALDILDTERTAMQTQLVSDELAVDGQLYDGFFGPKDKTAMALVRAADPKELGELELDADGRLKDLLPLYKARNYPQLLSADERAAWEAFCKRRLQSGESKSRLAKFAARLQALGEDSKTTEAQRYLLEELQLYAESIVVYDEM
jgi:exodeoxyribonuclease-1